MGGRSRARYILWKLYDPAVSSYHILTFSPLYCAYIKGGVGMGNIDLGTLITGAICSIGMIQLITWIVVVIKHPGFDYLQPDLVQAATQPNASAKK